MKGYVYLFALAVIASAIVQLSGCTEMAGKKDEKPSEQQLVARGKYLVTAVGCHSCHSPKNMTENGPVVDESRMLSGHPSDMILPPVDSSVAKTTYWGLLGMDGTAFAGRWGMSFAANITPDSTTGIGAWNEEQFIKTLRTGKHLGMDGGRNILPPMPWKYYAKFNDEDLAAIFAYLKSLKPIRNKVPTPIPPNELGKAPIAAITP